MDCKNCRVFKLKYLGATNYLGARIRITDCRFKVSVVLNRDYEDSSYYGQCIKYLVDRGINIVCKGELSETENILVSDNFDVMIKEGLD